MLPVIVVHHSQEDRHKDVGVDNHIGYEKQAIPPTEIVSWHPAGEKQQLRNMLLKKIAALVLKVLLNSMQIFPQSSDQEDEL